jgi:DNA-binding Lrp family transcriptional regulator
MSSPAVKERLVRLEESGVLQRYRVDLSPLRSVPVGDVK